MKRAKSQRGKKQAVEGRMVAPVDRAGLREWVERVTGLRLPEKGVCTGHNTPLDYLEHVFFERGTTGDTVVWACRGGGKTMIGALATLLDVLFKPGIQVRILGGSLDQSEKMYGYLCGLVREHFADEVEEGTRIQRRGFRLRNGSRVEILTQSQKAVRGTRVQKMRCDEVELFDPEVWSAAQLTTRSLKEGDAVTARGAVEAFSTLHRPHGLMAKILTQGDAGEAAGAAPAARETFTWCILDVMEKCREEDRACGTCALDRDCGGRARKADGFVPVEDVLTIHGRAGRRAWEAEMLCHMPVPEEQVFSHFSALEHVRRFPREALVPGETVEAGDRGTLDAESLIAGIDYGWQHFACVWIALLWDGSGRRVAWVVDEYFQSKRTLAEHAAAIRGRGRVQGLPWKPAAWYGDVAGRQKDAHTGQSSEAIVQAAGIPVRSKAMPIGDGVAMLNALIHPAESWGAVVARPRLLVDPRAVHTIEALQGYRMKDGKPEKDGTHDHLVDALRYALMGHDGRGRGRMVVRGY